MEKEVINYLEKIFEECIYKVVISKPREKSQTEYQKISIIDKGEYYQAECFTTKQVFHFNYSKDQAKDFCNQKLSEDYLQLNAWSDSGEYQILISKKGKVSFVSKKNAGKGVPEKKSSHNNEKNYLLLEGKVIPPLVDMGIFTKEGKVVVSMYDKYKQINRFLEIINDSLKKYSYDKSRPIKVVDFGCGKSYLTFVLYYFLTEIKGLTVNMIGLDLKEDVINKCNQAAIKYGYANLSFMVGDVGAYKDDVPADMIITLHACDTATDYALFHAIKWNAKMIFSVPCCQHELNQQFSSDEFSIIGRYGIVRERTMALMTDAIRANLLECCGYKTNLMEFVDFDNTPKNLLIRAVSKKNSIKKIDVTKSAVKTDKLFAEVKTLMEEYHLYPTLYALLEENGYLDKYV